MKTNIVIPLAGSGSRFFKAGYKVPKPFIEIFGHKMIELVIKNITPKSEHQFIFLCQQEHMANYDLCTQIQKWAPNSIIIPIQEKTQGAACTVLMAKEYINNDTPLIIANCDQYIHYDINEFIQQSQKSDGCIMTMQAHGPKWSYVKLKENNVVEVAEKVQISNQATVGIYYYGKGSYFVEQASNMIKDNFRVNNEFYVAPVYNYIIQDEKKITQCHIGKVNKDMFGLGTPEDLEYFLTHVEEDFVKKYLV